MPIRKPKAVKLPVPFADQEQSADEHARRRALIMKRELTRVEGASFNAPPPGFFQRVGAMPRHRLVFALGALGMGAGLIGAFFVMSNTGMKPPIRIIYAESWDADRTAEDAIAEREEAMDVLRAEVARNRAAVAAEQARQRGLEAERAAARAATPGN